jgi:hypothetical protein
MGTGESNLKDESAVTNERTDIFDWLNLPSGATPVFLWDSLHDAEIVSLRSDLLERSMIMSCESEHLRSFHHLDEGFKFILQLEGVQSARVLRYAMWPGGCAIPAGLSRQEENKLIAVYQAKWREESASWNDFESGISGDSKQVFDISNATLIASQGGTVALKLCGHLNSETYHEVFIRSEALKISGSDGKQFGLEEFQRLGESYWEAFSRRAKSRDVR